MRTPLREALQAESRSRAGSGVEGVPGTPSQPYAQPQLSSRRRSNSTLSWLEDADEVGKAKPATPAPGPQKASGQQRGADKGAGDGRRAPITLSGPGFLPWLCCQVPGVLLFGLLGGLIVCAFVSKAGLSEITAKWEEDVYHGRALSDGESLVRRFTDGASTSHEHKNETEARTAGSAGRVFEMLRSFVAVVRGIPNAAGSQLRTGTRGSKRSKRRGNSSPHCCIAACVDTSAVRWSDTRPNSWPEDVARPPLLRVRDLTWARLAAHLAACFSVCWQREHHTCGIFAPACIDEVARHFQRGLDLLEVNSPINLVSENAMPASLGVDIRQSPRNCDKDCRLDDFSLTLDQMHSSFVELKQAAERLIEKTKHLFADVFATFHPVGRPGEVAGKSSNTQWAYKEMLTHYASDLARCDPTRVFISVGDADTLWHPQYFDALAYQALEMTPEEAAWTIWQPPMLLFRNLFAVPGVTRLGGLGTLLFELAGLTNQWLSPHMCFSSYSLTLILANHRFVAGWDADVVAEDHHMFCKCFFACLWEELDGDREKLPLKPKLKLSAIYLPAQGYLVESSEGYFQSCWARFQQARRHSQGVAELGYVLLQYIKLLLSAGPFRLSLSAHYKICAIMGKMFTVHIVNSVQAFALIVAGITTLPLLVVGLQEVLGNVFKGNDFSAIVAGFVNGVDSNAAFTAAKWSLLLAFGAGLSTDAAQQEQHQQQWSPP
ncbi:unnamed protein product [Polarella glacialis]|uniref:Uncharacterized protein n=1 Tax=Polarella glacialis TaxID=89957 RepID=A0A813H4L0_POLGL|nr:unnamed protein product [Polarella glacialis]